MNITSEAVDAATRMAIKSLTESSVKTVRLSDIVVFVRGAGLRVGDRDVDRSLQRLRKSGAIKYNSAIGWTIKHS